MKTKSKIPLFCFSSLMLSLMVNLTQSTLSAQTFPTPASLSTGQGAINSLDPTWLTSGWFYNPPPNPMGLTYSSALINNNCAPGNWIVPASLPPPVNNGNWITNPSYPCATDTSTGYMYFRLPLNLPADCNGASVTAAGNFVLNLTGYVDNTISDVFVNGISTGISGGAFTAATGLNITLPGPWVAGINYIDVCVLNFHEPNSPVNPYGLLLVANTSAANSFCCIPNLTVSTSTTCSGSNTALTANGGTKYVWNTGATTATMTDAPLLTTGYTVTVTDASSCVNTTVTSITVNSLPSVAISPTNPTCSTNNGSATANATGSAPGFSFLWSPGGATTQTINSLAPTSYSVTITDANNCTSTSSTILAQLAPKLTLSATGISTKCNGSCDGQAVVIPAGGTTPVAVLWSTGSTNLSINNVCAGNVTVTITDAIGCQHDSIFAVPQPALITETLGSTSAECNLNNGSAAVLTTIGGTGSYTYSWSNGTTAQTNGNISPATYTLTVSDANACTSTGTVTVLNTPGVKAVLLNTTPVYCNGMCTGNATAQANGGTAPYTYSWNNNSNNDSAAALCAGNYIITITDSRNCTSTVTAVITQPLALTLPAITPFQACMGQTANLTASPEGGTPAYTVNWNPGNFTGPILPASSLNPQTYTVSATDARGCNSLTQTITVHASPNVNFIASVTNGCPVLCTTFSDRSTVTADVITNWLWTFSNGSSSTSHDTAICFNTGMYSAKLQVTSSSGCSNIDSIGNMITVWPDPVAAFTTNPADFETIVNPVFNYSDQSTGGVTGWLWNFGDTTGTDTLQNTVHKYTNMGTYCTLLTVATINQCKDTVSHCVHIIPDFEFFIPNAFTPNGNGMNESFSGKGIGISSYQMLVFDRWGNMLFMTHDLNQGWNGMANGGTEVAQQDVYSYVIEIKDVYNKPHKYIGTIALMR